MNKTYKVLKDFDSLGFKKGQVVLITEEFAKANTKHFKENKPVTKAQTGEPEVKEQSNGSNS